MNVWEQIYTFNTEVLGVEPMGLGMLNADEVNDLHAFISEETDEFVQADTMVEQVDALLDLIYFAVGGLTKVGMTPDEMAECMTAVHTANMTKSLGKKDTRPDIQGTDARKPPGFVAPDEAIKRILEGGM